MGSLFSPNVYTIYMEKFEKETLANAEHPQEKWKRCVDDTYTILKKVHAQAFTNHLNSMDEDVKWTTEGEVTTVVPLVGVRNGERSCINC